MNIPLDAILIPFNADSFNKEIAVHTTDKHLIIDLLKDEHQQLVFDVSILPDLVDALIELQNKNL